MENNLNQVIVLIPSYRPSEKLLELVRKLQSMGIKNLVVVNDGSPVSYNPIFSSLSDVHLICYPKNGGKGFALKAGFTHIKNNFNNDNFVITCDDDGQHASEDVLRLAQKVSELNPNTVILGTRKFGIDTPFKSRIGNFFMRFLITLFFRRLLKDTQTGLRCIPISIVKRICNLPQNDFSFEIVSLIHYLKSRTVLLEIPIRTIYFNNNESTRFRSFLDSVTVILSVIISYLKK